MGEAPVRRQKCTTCDRKELRTASGPIDGGRWTTREAARLHAPRGFPRAFRRLAEARTALKVATGAVVLVQLAVTSPAATPGGSVDFTDLTQALRAYQEKPSFETAAGVRALLPREGHIKFDDSTPARTAREALEGALPALEAQVEIVDRDSVRLALNLLAVIEPPISDSLGAILGGLITTDAKAFLEELLRWRTQLTPRTLGQLVGSLGKKYAERDRVAACAEIQRRIDALLAVSEAALIEARDQCVAELRQRRPRCG